MQELELIKLGKGDIDSVMSKLSNQDFDKPAFGAIELDAAGNVLKYNAAECAIARRDPKSVIGKNFFREVAPCTATPMFKGVFETGVKNNDLTSMFEYVFDHQMKPTKLRVHMKNSFSGKSFRVLVQRI